MLVNHILVGLVLIGMPVTAILEFKRINNAVGSFVREKLYYKIFFLYWTITLLFILFSSFDSTLSITSISENLTIVRIALIVSLVYLTFDQFLPIVLIFFSRKMRQLTAKTFSLVPMHPVTFREKKVFWIVPITVGICEEIIFRGYLFQYFQASPYGLSAALSLLLVSLLFGIGHFQQGMSGIIMTIFLGLFLGSIYLLTGSLILPILIHIIFDAKILFIPWVLQRNQKSDEEIVLLDKI
ncbi:CPBP family intramembrane metalloprotease [Paenibacillus psychroresistens]|uniref:CPBP family intramembrane metalloprotease n=1 Tax=Paenibacillus psychroresistens TaxID=1778678 RepID=A0A6B8RNZ5_9BACL|nr:CPBP family intramembrane glutamic endopeptidase [Paenibacillus psychroresistens]QGQ97038.1 CPBP family intramembrane metalloprotease [Paenibacillus psychroresistens]